MPLGLPRGIAAQLASGNFVATSVIKVAFAASQGGPRRWTTLGREIAFAGETYLPSQDFVSFNYPDQKLERDVRQLILSDHNGAWRRRLERSGAAGIPVEARQGIVLAARAAGMAAGDFYPLITYKGVTDSFTVEFAADGFPTMAIQTASRFVKLDSQPRVSTAAAYQKSLDATDTSMDSSHVARRFKWYK